MLFWEEEKKRKPFSTRTKKIEWMLARGDRAFNKDGTLAFVKNSQCRVCKTPLTWGDRRYNFDHKDNNPLNSTQKNCRLVCRNCHGKHTVIKKRKVTGILGETVGYKTIKMKVGYKKPKKKPKITKRVAIRDILGNITGYRTVKVRQVNTVKKSTINKSKKKNTSTEKTKRKRKKSRDDFFL